ncbi:MAG: hypothetical protein HC933_08025 [Pleurocapsa sp. SU_196_0]|nr:hypothetical protein [Pleurocapsa sp. SU_196_0]
MDAGNANLQLFTTAEASAITTLLPANTGTILEYGYRTNENSVANGADGTFTVSYRLPVTSSNTDATSFIATIAVAKDGPARVSQSVEDNTFDVNFRTSAATTEIAYLGPGGEDADLTATNLNAAVTMKLRLANLKTAAGATPAFMLSSYALTPNLSLSAKPILDTNLNFSSFTFKLFLGVQYKL